MNIILSGYGKMGREIEKQAIKRGHKVILKIDRDNSDSISSEDFRKGDVCIEFSTPETAASNIKRCFAENVPVIVGTTGWLEHLEEIKKLCLEKNQSFFHASNFSIGVNLFFRLNSFLARLMNERTDYKVSIEEIHHVHKLDSPSGTAISLASQILDNIERKEIWVNRETDRENELEIISKRIDEIPGTHTVSYTSEVDRIDMTHTAYSREGFALGAVIAAEWIQKRKGCFTMDDMLSF